MLPDKDEQTNNAINHQENDWLLESYVRTLNGTEGQMHITILIDGFLVSGLLVGGNRYFQEILDRYLKSDVKDLDDSIKQLQTRIDSYTVDRFKPEVPVFYIHLLSATFHHPIGPGMPRKGVSFRARQNRVSGFYFGGYMPQKGDVETEQVDSDSTD
ncbi:hypothetical protein [Dyadobacter sp. CY347]|uniref:hypothetical protein n=1 Tax=Dyadobacter sp. CY347 TaxID=2909336 RepID=UPI001F35555D|nr:hypothetical protein [Dyadobacter sp. CY347]MCF2491610.1 hypothetical protein [Dyadobacter sp. CY347]